MFDIFIRRPVLALVVNLLILLLGVQALLSLQVRQFPEMFNTVITITTTFPGADAELMQGFITDPIQKAVASADGVDYLTSRSAAGISEIRVYVRLNEDPDAAMTSVSAKVSQVRAQLPRGINDPAILKSTGDTFPSLYLAFLSDTMNESQITDYLIRVVQPRLATLPGVAEAELWGGRSFAMRIWLDPERMAAHRLSSDEVRAAIEANNFLATAGSAKGRFDVVGTTARTDLRSEEEFRQLVIRGEAGRLLRLGDVAEVELGPQNVDMSVFVNGKKAVYLGIKATPDANVLAVSRAVHETLPELQRRLPQGLNLLVDYDAAVFIEAAIRQVLITLVEAVLIVVLVIFLFMGSFRSVLIPLVTMPLSLVGVCLLLLVLGFTLNLLTLLAMVLAIGLVVDDAIVVVENVHRHIERGETPLNAALLGIREIAMPVISMTITLAAVYAPIAFMGGLTGALFKEFTLTLAGAVLVSGVVALTLSPVMCSKILLPARAASGLQARIDSLIESVRARYDRWLGALLPDRSPVVVFAAIVFASLWFLLSAVPTELAPEEDKGYVFIAYQGPASANLDYLDMVTQDLPSMLASLPELDFSFIANGLGATHLGFAIATFKPWDERERDQAALIPAVQALLDDIPGIRGSVFAEPPLPGSDGLPVQFEVTTTADYRALDEVAQRVLERARESGLFAFVDTNLKFDKPQTIIDIDRDKAAAYGVRMEDIAGALGLLTGGDYINLMNLHSRSYQVIPQVPRAARLDGSKLGEFHLSTASGAAVPLASLISLRTEVEPADLHQFNQQNAARIEGVPMPGVALGSALAYLERTAEELLPEGFSYEFGGQSRQFVQEGNSLFAAFALALMIIYLVLSAQFNSFRDPLVILVSVPLSMCGALIPLALGLSTMNIYTQVGLITLIGLISKHGILICEVAKEQQRLGRSRREAVAHAASLRLRPILMTTAAMVAGMLPLLFAGGAGAASRFAIALVIVAGMSIGTLFTLFVLPVVYTFIASDHRPVPAAASSPA